MTTLGTLLDQIATDTRRSGTAWRSTASTHVTTAIKHYQRQRFYFNESRDTTFTTIDTQFAYDMTDDIEMVFYKIDLAVLEESTNDHELIVRDYRELELLQTGGSSTGRPTDYAYIGESLLLYPVPDSSSYSIRLTGHIKVDAPASEGEGDNLWMTEAFDLIRSRVMWSLHKRVLHRHDEAAQYKADEMDELGLLKRQMTAKVSTGTIQPAQF